MAVSRKQHSAARRRLSPSAIQPDGYPDVLAFDEAAWPGERLFDKAWTYAIALTPDPIDGGRGRSRLADATIRTYQRVRGYGTRGPIPATVPPFAPSSGERLRITLDAYRWVYHYGLALDFHAVARGWLAEHGDAFEPGDAPATERERFGF